MNPFKFKVCDPKDQENIIDLLGVLKDELFLPNREVCQNIVELCFERGGVIGGYHGSVPCAMMGYFVGDPALDYANREVAFMYVAGIRLTYRLSRMFHKGLLFSCQHFQDTGLQSIRLQAEAANPYTNKLYSRFAHPIAKGKSLRGKDVITYGGSVDAAIHYLQQGKGQRIVLPISLPQRSVELLAVAT